MRLRVALVSGVAIGYVLGARAGRQRYEQIRRAFKALCRSKPAQEIRAEVRGVTSRAGQRIETKAAQGVAKVTDRLRGRNSGRYGSGNGHGGSHNSSVVFPASLV
jgi:hypothetical protein